MWLLEETSLLLNFILTIFDPVIHRMLVRVV